LDNNSLIQQKQQTLTRRPFFRVSDYYNSIKVINSLTFIHIRVENKYKSLQKSQLKQHKPRKQSKAKTTQSKQSKKQITSKDTPESNSLFA
jgi:hypothetical protein